MIDSKMRVGDLLDNWGEFAEGVDYWQKVLAIAAGGNQAEIGKLVGRVRAGLEKLDSGTGLEMAIPDDFEGPPVMFLALRMAELSLIAGGRPNSDLAIVYRDWSTSEADRIARLIGWSSDVVRGDRDELSASSVALGGLLRAVGLIE